MLSLKACNGAIQKALSELNGGRTVIRKMGILPFFLDQGVKYPVAKRLISTDGTYKKYQITSVKKNCDVTADCSTNICNDTTPLLHHKVYDQREIKKCYASKPYEISESDLRDLCTGDTPLQVFREMFAGIIEPWFYGLNQKLLAELYALRGVHPQTGQAITSIPLLNNDYVPTPFAQNIALDFDDTGLFGKPTLIGGRNVQLYKKALSIGGNNQFGQNTGRFEDFELYYEPKLNTLAQNTRDNALAIADGVVHFVTFSENVGMFGDEIINKDLTAIIRDLKSGETFHKGVIDLIDLMPELREIGINSFIVDLHFKYDDCDNKYRMQIKLHYDIWVTNPEICESNPLFNGIVHYQFCEPVVPTCAPTTPPAPLPSAPVRCFDLPCSFPYNIYTVNGISIGPLTATTQAEMVSILNQVNLGQFYVSAGQIKYVGWATSLKINDIDVTLGACTASACYQAVSSVELTPVQLSSYAAFGVIAQIVGTPGSYTYQLVPSTSQTLVQVQDFETNTAQNSLTWTIPASSC